VARKAKPTGAGGTETAPVIETTATEAAKPPQAPSVGASSGASRAEVQAAVRLLHAVVGGIDACIDGLELRESFCTVWNNWRVGWGAFVAGVEKPIWDLDATAATTERQIDQITKWRGSIKAEIGGGTIPWLFDEMPVFPPATTRQRAGEIVTAAQELDAPMQRLDNPGAKGAWSAWFDALRRYRERIDGSWWIAVSGETAHTLGIFADQVEEWRKRLVRYEKESSAEAKEKPAAQQAEGAPPKAGWPTWAKVASVIGILGGSYYGVRWVINHWASNTPVRVELPGYTEEQKKEPSAA